MLISAENLNKSTYGNSVVVANCSQTKRISLIFIKLNHYSVLANVLGYWVILRLP